jgi:hypothetical protein
VLQVKINPSENKGRNFSINNYYHPQIAEKRPIVTGHPFLKSPQNWRFFKPPQQNGFF